MSLIAQYDKFATLSKRETSFTDEKTGKPTYFRYVTGFDCVSGSTFGDVTISEDSPISHEQVEENAVYDCVFKFSIIKGEKNAQRLTSVKLVRKIGHLEIKMDK